MSNMLNGVRHNVVKFYMKATDIDTILQRIFIFLT